MIADFAQDIADVATPNVTRVQRAAPQYVKGRAIGGSTTSTALVASIQRPTGRQVALLPQGQNPEETIVIYTATSLNVAKTEIEGLADHILYNGDEYEVQTVRPWDDTGNYFEARAVKLKVGA